jgi:putative DNA primase/helicase
VVLLHQLQRVLVDLVQHVGVNRHGDGRVSVAPADLQKGELRDFNRHDRITKQGGLEYDPATRCPRWLAFLEHVMGGDTKMVAFLKRAAGYTLTGETSEQCFFLLHGSGANGKSTFLEVLRRLLGSYGRPTEFKTLVDSNRNDGVRNDLAALQGLRLVTAVETNRGRRFDEALIKQLTGGDEITARYLYGEFFDFYPTFKLWLAVNHKPEIRGVDEGIWRRVVLIPFEVTIPPADQVKDLAAKLLEDEGSAIMAWAVEGTRAWQRPLGPGARQGCDTVVSGRI